MSRFYGTVKGSSGNTATRPGTPNSGLVVHAAGWKGAIRVDVQPDSKNPKQDNFTVWLVPWKKSDGRMVMLAQGVLDSSANVSRACEVPS